MWKVFYEHRRGYEVFRSFTTQEKAQEFIDVNALVFPLPCVRLVNPDGEEVQKA